VQPLEVDRRGEPRERRRSALRQPEPPELERREAHERLLRGDGVVARADDRPL
jgi:hypothetical protein